MSFAIDLSHDLRCRLSLVNKGNALPGPERQCVDITFGVGGGGVRSIAHNRPTRFRCSDNLALTRPLARRGTAGGFPTSNSTVAQYAMRCLGPADVEQFFQINGIVFCCPQKSLAIVRVNRHLIARKKTGSDPSPRRAERQSCREPTPIGDASRSYHWNRPYGIDHCGNERHRRDFSTHMATGFPTLGDNDVDATVYCLTRFCGRADRMKHNGTTRLRAGHKG